jgi:hypothetical protein
VTLSGCRYEIDCELSLDRPIRILADLEASLILVRPGGRIVASGLWVVLERLRLEVAGTETDPVAALVARAGLLTLSGCELRLTEQDHPAEERSVAILAQEAARVQLEGTRLSGFAVGVLAEGEAKVTVSSCAFSEHSNAAVSATQEAEVVVLDSRIARTGQRAIRFEGSASGRIERNQCIEGPGVGIELLQGTEAVVRGNLISSFGLEGLVLDGGGPVSIVNNLVTGCQDGMALGSGRPVLHGNMLWRNRRHGIVVISGGARITRNCSSENGEHGLFVADSHGALNVEQNLFQGNGVDGMNLAHKYRSRHRLGLKVHTSSNRLFRNGRFGIAACEHAWLVAEADESSHNASDAAYFGDDANCKIARCRFEYSGGFGVLLVDRAGASVHDSRFRGNSAGGIASLAACAPIIEGNDFGDDPRRSLTLLESHRPAQGARSKFVKGVRTRDIRYLPTADVGVSAEPRSPRPSAGVKATCLVSGVECHGFTRVWLTARQGTSGAERCIALPLLAVLNGGSIECIEWGAATEVLAPLFAELGASPGDHAGFEQAIEALARQPRLLHGHTCEVRFVDDAVYRAVISAVSATVADTPHEQLARGLSLADLLSEALGGPHPMAGLVDRAVDAALHHMLGPDLLDVMLFLRGLDGGRLREWQHHPFVAAVLTDRREQLLEQ